MRRVLAERADACRRAGDAAGAARAEHAIRKAAGSPAAVVIRKSAADTAGMLDRVEKAAATIEGLRAERLAGEVLDLCRRGDREAVAKAGELLNDPDTYEAYRCRLAGERYVHLVAKAAAPDHRAELRKLLVAGDHAGLGEVLKRPGAWGQYLEVSAEPATVAAAAEFAKRQRARTPADVSEAEKAPFKAKIKALLARAKSDPAAKRDVRGQAAWIDLVHSGEVKAAA